MNGEAKKPRKNVHKYGEYFHPAPRTMRKLEKEGQIHIEEYIQQTSPEGKPE